MPPIPPSLFVLFISATVFTTMVGLGLGLRGDAPALVRERPGLFLRGLMGTCLLVPLVALVLLKLPGSTAIGAPGRFAIALMALCPSAPLTLRKAGKQGGDRELAATLQVAAALLAIVSIPLLADLFRSAFRLEGWEIGHRQVALQVGKAQLLPLLLGLLLRRWRPAFAARIQPGLDRLANILLLLVVLLVLAAAGAKLVPFLVGHPAALAAMALMSVAALVIGALLSGPDPGERTTLALVTSMRNPGLALLFASSFAPGDMTVKIAILSYLLITVLVSVPFLRQQRRLQEEAQPGR